MKKKILLFVLIAALVFVIPAAAKEKVPVGERINVYAGTPTTYPAGEPFHIAHGLIINPPENVPVGPYYIRLEVDGVTVEQDYIDRQVVNKAPAWIWFRYVFNFPDGMTGTHTFNAYVGGPCGYLVEVGLYPGPCATPSELVEIWPASHTVTFTP